MRKNSVLVTQSGLESLSETRLTELRVAMSYRAVSVKTRPCVFLCFCRLNSLSTYR